MTKHRRPRGLRARLLTCTALGTACVVLLAGATGATAGTPQPQDTTAPSGPPAPAGFAQQLQDIYAQVNTLAQKYPPQTGIGLPSQSDFQTQVSGLTQDQLNQIYDANPGVWDEAQSALNTGIGQSSQTQALTKPSNSKPSKAAPTKTPTKSTKSVKMQANDTTVPDFPTPPTLVTCADESTFEGLHAASYALQTTSQSLHLAADAIAFALAFAPEDEVLVVAGEGGTVGKDPIWGILADIQAGLVVGADAVDIAQGAVDFQAGQIADCFGVYDAAEQDYIFEAVQDLGHMGQTIIGNQGDIENAISTGFSTTYGKLANLQTSVDTAQASLDLALKERIESALLGGATSGITDFQLPNSAGGYLDATPIGVKEVVTDALHAMQANKQAMGTGAAQYTTLANSYLTQGKYKQAFAEYQLAYQAISKTSTTQGS